MLLGGSKKGLDYKQLFSQLSKRVVKIVAYGEIANDLIFANDDKFELIKTKNLNFAFDKAVEISNVNDTILLSPATASYDEFNSYLERGEFFNKKVQEYETISKKK